MPAAFGVPPCYERADRGRFVTFLRRGFEGPLAELCDPLETLWRRLEHATPVARGRGRVAVWSLPGRDERVVLRRYAHGGLLAGLFGHRLLGLSRPLRELSVTEHARSSEVAAPLVLGAVIERRLGPVCRAALITAEVENSEDMIHFLRRIVHESAARARQEKLEAMADAARQIRALHVAGIDHADLHLKNLLVRHDEDGHVHVVLIDLDRAKVRDRRFDGVCLRNLMRLARSVRKLRVSGRALTRWDRLRFLRCYLEDRADAAERLRPWATRLARSGLWHELWWWLVRPDRDLGGDRMPGPGAATDRGGGV